ncbi:MAG: hypothetical protein Q9208_006973 [Pyrenodesmia sp. 3 TL-2023]
MPSAASMSNYMTISGGNGSSQRPTDLCTQLPPRAGIASMPVSLRNKPESFVTDVRKGNAGGQVESTRSIEAAEEKEKQLNAICENQENLRRHRSDPERQKAKKILKKLQLRQATMVKVMDELLQQYREAAEEPKGRVRQHKQAKTGRAEQITDDGWVMVEEEEDKFLIL